MGKKVRGNKAIPTIDSLGRQREGKHFSISELQHVWCSSSMRPVCFEKSNICISKFKKIVKKVHIVIWMYTTCVQFFVRKYIDTWATQKVKIARFLLSEQYMHCSCFQNRKFVMCCVARVSMHFLMKFFAQVAYIHMAMWIFSEFYETLKCDFWIFQKTRSMKAWSSSTKRLHNYTYLLIFRCLGVTCFSVYGETWEPSIERHDPWKFLQFNKPGLHFLAVYEHIRADFTNLFICIYRVAICWSTTKECICILSVESLALMVDCVIRNP